VRGRLDALRAAARGERENGGEGDGQTERSVGEHAAGSLPRGVSAQDIERRRAAANRRAGGLPLSG
jgi:hypothetical protein